jgi:hypothetical protein
MNENITLTLEWFDENDIPAYCDNGTIYVQFGDCDIQISSAEIEYRAELQKEFGNNQ